jgi:hypothetical protein
MFARVRLTFTKMVQVAAMIWKWYGSREQYETSWTGPRAAASPSAFSTALIAGRPLVMAGHRPDHSENIFLVPDRPAGQKCPAGIPGNYSGPHIPGAGILYGR